MNTRSQIRNKVSNEMVQYEVNIDFDEAISAWRTNKKSMGNGQYQYIYA